MLDLSSKNLGKKKWIHITLGIKTAIVPVFLIITLILTIGLSIYSIEQQKFDTFIVSIASRQGTLNQRYMKEITLASEGITVDYQKTQNLLMESVDALINGGSVRIDNFKLENQVIPAVPTSEIQKKLKDQKGLLMEFDSTAKSFLQLEQKNDLYLSTLTQLLFLNQKVNTSATEIVLDLQDYNEKKIALAIQNVTIIGLITIILSIILTFILNRNIVLSLKKAIQVVTSAAEQLAAFAKQNTEIAHFNSSIAKDVARGAKQQSQEAEKISKTATLMAEEVKKIAYKAKYSAEISDDVFEKTKTAGEESLHSKSSLQEIQKNSELTSVVVEKLYEKSREIHSITESIGIITEKTNLLSINASIEAAKSGEFGRGFAVIAKEIRDLAEQSAKSAIEIKKLISFMQEYIDETAESVKNGKITLEQGVQTIDKSLDILQSILPTVENSTKQVKSIAKDIEEQSLSTNNIAQTMDSIAAIVEQNSTSSKQLSESIEEQTNLTSKVAQTVQQMQEIVINLQMLTGFSSHHEK